MADAYFAMNPAMDKLQKGNVFARLRMIVAFVIARILRKALVIGTSNKTESLLGYSTLFGDSASAINPIGDLYKTQVRQLAKETRRAGIYSEDKKRRAPIYGPGQIGRTRNGIDL